MNEAFLTYRKTIKRKDMKLILGIATRVWYIVMVVMPSLAIRDGVVREQLQVPDYPTVTFDFEDGASGYSTFMTSLRGNFTGPFTVCGLPVTRNQSAPGGEYVLVELKISDRQWVTVALKVTDLYLVAYSVNKLYSGKYRAIFFNEPDVAVAKTKLFIGSTQVTLAYDSNYRNIQKYSTKEREKLDLGLSVLRAKINAFYDEKPVTSFDEADFFLIAIQMVAEAARYKYIEDKVVATEYTAFKPDAKMMKLENDWSKNSETLHKAKKEKRCQSQEVMDIKKDIKLLLHEKNQRNISVSGGGLCSQIASIVVKTDVIEG